jgi:hypothetical protein
MTAEDVHLWADPDASAESGLRPRSTNLVCGLCGQPYAQADEACPDPGRRRETRTVKLQELKARFLAFRRYWKTPVDGQVIPQAARQGIPHPDPG